MTRRIISFLMAVVILGGMVFAGAFTVSAASAMTTSDDCIKVLKAEEGFSRTPYWDYAQYTVGYGTKCPENMREYYTKNGITEAEAEVLLRNHLAAVERDINSQIIDKYKLTMTQNQFDALIMFSYNCGTGWTYETGGTFHTAIAQGKTGNDIVRAFALWCVAGDGVKTFLLRRRLCEANMYLNAVYSQTPPDNYGYVIYEPNGGSVSPKSQGYIAGEGVKPFSVPTREGYTFTGWYTDRSGGTKVETLEKANNGKTLYARWEDASGNTPEQEEEYPVKITVTGTDVRIRKGPGTNYSVVGYANKGQTMTVTETAFGSGYRWGKYAADRWICLTYTNYDKAVIEQKPVPETTTPPETEDTTPPETETTVPETTVPETTVPETTVPETTVPETTVPPTTTPPATTTKVTGTVTTNDLRIRSGPSTGYSIVGYLGKGAKVEILEKKTVGTMVWGKIAKGWISMDYVKLDTTSSSGGTTTTPSNAITGTITGNDLRIRSGAGTNYSIVGYLNKGAKVTITEKKTVGSTTWGKIANGWISMAYVKVDQTSSGTTTTPTTPTTPTVTTITGTVTGSDLRVRSGPGTSYAVKTYLAKGTKVTITEKKTVGSTTWGKIASGWISLDYVKLDSQSSTPAKQTKTVTADCLLIRSGAGTGYKIVGYLYYGAKVEITETTTAGGLTWGKTAKGWICLKYVK